MSWLGDMRSFGGRSPPCPEATQTHAIKSRCPPDVRLRGPAFFMLLGGISFFGTAVPGACHDGRDLAPAEAGATGGGGGGEGGIGGARMMDGGLPDVAPTDGAATDVAATDVAATDGAATDGAATDVAATDVAATDGTTGGDMSDGPPGGDGAGTDGGSADAMFSCGPCGINWSCGGAS